MVDKQKARIFFVLDRSGSMKSIETETIGGFNAFVESQKAVPGKATFSLIQFDNEYDVVHDNIKLKDVPALTNKTFVPRGMTALYDAIGVTISKYKNDNPKNTKTIVAILTDGQENSSKEFKYQDVQKMIKEVQDEKGWDVLFIGANMDVQAVSASLGIKLGNAVAFDCNAKGAGDAMKTMGFAAGAMRGMSSFYADGSAIDANNLDMSKLYSDVKNEKL